jgi:hypothetical protein
VLVLDRTRDESDNKTAHGLAMGGFCRSGGALRRRRFLLRGCGDESGIVKDNPSSADMWIEA